MPSRWTPWQVESPETGLPFTEPAAWQLIADKLSAGHLVRVVALKTPSGASAFEMLIDRGGPRYPIYVKVQLFKGRVYGRSFHVAEFKDLR